MAADGSIVIDVDLDNKKAQQELNKLNKKIESLNDQIYIKQQQQMPLIEQSRQLGAELDAAKAKLNSSQAQLEENEKRRRVFHVFQYQSAGRKGKAAPKRMGCCAEKGGELRCFY